MSSEITHHCVVVNRANIFICIEHAHSTSIPMHTSLTHTSSMHTTNMWYEHAAAKCDGLAADGPPVMSDTFLHPFLIPHLAFFPTIHPCTIRISNYHALSNAACISPIFSRRIKVAYSVWEVYPSSFVLSSNKRRRPRRELRLYPHPISCQAISY